MKREIKFRGKIIDTGEWVYGTVAYSEDEKRAYIVEFLEVNQRTGVDYKFHEVSPNTIGQYTDLKDKNGREIYEGDILKVNECYYDVEWYNDCYLYGGYFLSALREGNKEFEVVGNIHKNPELLEE